MKRIIILWVTMLPLQAMAQTMWYEGGKGDGNAGFVLNSFSHQLVANYYPYMGGKNDGGSSGNLIHFAPILTESHYPYLGGMADGNASKSLNSFQPVLIANHYPYLGGVADGYATNNSNAFQPILVNNHYPYLGGKGDGWSNALSQSYALPLVLLSFEGQAMEDYNALHWKTSIEENVDYFLVEKSKSGVDFTSIGLVNAVGNSTREQSYDFNDKHDVQGVNYYKLRMTDIDNSYTFSKVIKLINEKLDYSVLLAPNPARDQISIRLSRAMNTSSQFTVLDMTGKVLLRKIIGKDEAVKHIDIQSLAPGQYMIYLNLANDIMSLPFIKQ